jgi:PAS domain S-box-containing protein
MDSPPRILFVADSQVAIDTLGAVRQGGPVLGQLAPTAEVLRATLMEPDAAESWDAVVFVPGGPVDEVEVAVYVPDGVPLFVVGTEVPLLLTETAAVPVPVPELDALIGRIPTTAPTESASGGGEATDPVRLGAVPADPAPAPEPTPEVPSESTRPAAPPPSPLAEAPRFFDDAPPEADEDAPADPVAALFESLDAFGAPSVGEPAERAVEAAPPEPPPEPAPAAAEPTEAVADGAMPAHLASIADHLPIGLYRSSPEGRVLYANPALATFLQVESVEALQTLDVQADLGYPRDTFAAQIAETGSVRNLVVTWRRPDGALVHTRENARSLFDEDGRLVAYEGTMEDVTAEVEGRREERAVARQHRAVAAFAATAALADDPVTIHCAAVGALLDATDAAWACLLTGDDFQPAATAGEVPGSVTSAGVRLGPLADQPVAIPDTSAAAPAAAAGRMAELGVPAFGAVPVRVGDGVEGVLVWGYAAPREILIPERRGAEALAWHVGGHLDRAAAVQALRDTQASLAAIAEHTPHVLYRLRYTPGGGRYEYLSPAVERLTGHTREQIEAMGGPGALVETREVLEGEGLANAPVPGAEAYRALYRMSTALGTRWVENSARPWLDAAGQPVGLVGVLQDVTERKEREDRLADAAQTALIRQRALVDLAHLDGADAFGGPAAGVVAATLGASDVSFWLCESGRPCSPLHAPPPADPAGGFDGAFAAVLSHVAEHRALAVADAASDPRIAELGLSAFVRTYGLRSLLVAPIRRHGGVVGLVAVHRSDGAHDWDASETEFAAAVADAVALALEREDREIALAQLVEAREAAEAGRAAAERMNRLKSAFLANMSHEFRTPLTGILGFTELLAGEVPEGQREMVGLIERNGARLLDTLNAVLDLSRLEAGEYDAERRVAPLEPLVRLALDRLAEEAHAKGLRFDADLDPDVAAAVDPEAIRQIVTHVAGNAVKFTDAGGVLVTLEGTADEAVLRVADTGLGISQGFLPEVMDAFRQEDSGHARSHEGSGLGLTITRQLVHLQDGRIEIESEQPGGTAVTITFPRVALRPRAPRLADRAPALPVGDGLASSALDVRPTPGPRADPGNLLGDPFDFTFLSTPTAPAAPVPATPPPPPDPTDMFDFRFGRSQAADPAPEPTPDPKPALSAPRPPAPPAPPSRPAPPRAAPAGPAPETDTLDADDPVMIVRAKPDPAPAAGPTIPEAAPPEDAEIVAEPSGDGRPTILVVEDNDDTRMLLERILRSTYDVTAVGDARSALLAMNQQRFSGLVLDINLGGKETGADVLRIARSLPQYDGVFAIALTAYALPGDRERLLESGFSAYISKPFTRQSLMETLADGVTA